MAYATTAQLCQQFDRRDIAGMCSETDTPVVPATVESNPIALMALEQASARIRSAAMIAGKYSEADLETLASTQDAFLVDLTCQLAFGQLLNRRGVQREKLPPVVERAENWLAALRLGEAILNVADNIDKGNMQTHTPTTVTLADAGFVTSVAAGKYFPARSE